MKQYKFRETDEIRQYLIEIEANKLVFDYIKLLPEAEENIRRESLLKSAIYSAKIEGIPMVRSIEPKRKEVTNLVKAYRQVYMGKKYEKLTIDVIRNIHMMVMDNISEMAGKFRQEPWAIYNSAGFVIYLAPSFLTIPKMMKEYINYMNRLDCHSIIRAAIGQFVFEKIHPFADGNGRVGRLISALILKNNNFHFRGILPFEEYTDNNRMGYYDALESNIEMTDFIEYFLKSVAETGRMVIARINESEKGEKNNLLAPRRGELVNIIKDHPLCSFEFLSRRFASVNPKTLHYDLRKLQDLGLIKKVGKTRGCLYVAD